VEEQVVLGRADWVDPADPRKGIICRETLYFGERPLKRTNNPSKKRPIIALCPREFGGARYQVPQSPAWQEEHARRTRSLQTLAYMTLKGFRANLEATSVDSRLTAPIAAFASSLRAG
jgi:hypothetical protein